MKEKYSWKIECKHTPETIDRILLPIRKRGLCVLALNYKANSESTATCVIEFEIDSADIERVYKNLIRIHDIQEIIR